MPGRVIHLLMKLHKNLQEIGNTYCLIPRSIHSTSTSWAWWCPSLLQLLLLLTLFLDSSSLDSMLLLTSHPCQIFTPYSKVGDRSRLCTSHIGFSSPEKYYWAQSQLAPANILQSESLCPILQPYLISTWSYLHLFAVPYFRKVLL